MGMLCRKEFFGNYASAPSLAHLLSICLIFFKTRTLVIPSVSLIAKELTEPLYTLVTQREGTD